MYRLKKFFVHSPGHYIGAAILAVAVGIFRYCTLAEGVSTRLACYEIFSVAGFVTVLIGMLLTVAYLGAFDLFGYVFSPGRTGEHRKYKSYADYCQQKAEKRAREQLFFVPYYVVGVVLVLIACLFG